MDHAALSEIVTGLVLRKKLAPGGVDVSKLMAPYDAIIDLYASGKTELSDLVGKYGVSPITAALNAVDAIADVGDLDWLRLLAESKNRAEIGDSLLSISKKLQRGEEIDNTKLRGLLDNLIDGTSSGRKKLSEINEMQDPLVKIGWKPWDEHIGGMPSSGLVVIAGNPGVGKTALVANITNGFIGLHPDKNALIYSLEMTGSELKERFLVYNPDMPKEMQDRVEVNDLPLDVREIITDASTAKNVGIVFVDFADLLVRGEVSEAQMGAIYVTLSLGAKSLGCPIVLLSQLSRGYQGGIPRPRNIRYTSLAEALAHQLVMLWNPSTDFYEDTSNDLLTNRNLSYLLFWKVRSGFRVHPTEGPGAIGVRFSGTQGWIGDKSRWFSLKGAIGE